MKIETSSHLYKSITIREESNAPHHKGIAFLEENPAAVYKKGGG